MIPPSAPSPRPCRHWLGLKNDGMACFAARLGFTEIHVCELARGLCCCCQVDRVGSVVTAMVVLIMMVINSPAAIAIGSMTIIKCACGCRWRRWIRRRHCWRSCGKRRLGRLRRILQTCRSLLPLRCRHLVSMPAAGCMAQSPQGCHWEGRLPPKLPHPCQAGSAAAA